MPITFPCACGTTLTVAEDPPVYFVRCPACKATVKVPHPRKRKKAGEPAGEETGFEVIDETRPRSTAYDRPTKSEDEEEWEKSPYREPEVQEGYEVGRAEPVARGATQGAGEAEPYEVSEEEFQEELQQRRRGRGTRKLMRAVWLGIVAVIGIGAFFAVGYFTRAIDPGGKGKIGAGLARIAILFTMLIVMLVIWLVNQGGPDDE